MEIQLEIRGKQSADEVYAAQILELMSLYSVRLNSIIIIGRN